MLFKLVTTLIGLSVAFGVNVNEVISQYFIGTFNGNEFPLSIGTCNPLDIFGQNGYQKAECVDKDALTWYYYLDEDCSTVVTSVEYNSSVQTGTGTANDFNCRHRAVQAYAEIEFSAFTCFTESKVTMNAAIGVCAFLAEDEVSIQTYCERGFAELNYFDSEGETGADCGEDDLYNVANATTECDFMLKTSGIKVYGQIISCVGYNKTTGPPTTTEEATTGVSTTMITTDSSDTSDTSDSNRNQLFTFSSFAMVAIFGAIKLN